MIGHLVDGKYEILRLLGQGGMGAVYEGVHTGTGKRVAIKIISAGLEKNEDMVRRFQLEARAAGQIDTQHIVQIYDTGIDEQIKAPFMVMELLAGQDLAQLIHRIGALPPDLALRVVAQACFGLQKAHEAGVVHRDIKPANLFLARREAGEVIVKILDFGIAKMKLEEGGAASHALTRTGAMLGSPLYMSPEQAKGLKTIDARSDVWSLGAVLYEALTARAPHYDIETLGQLILSICNEPPKPVQDHAPWVPPEVAAIAHGALVLDPAGRFQTAAAMLEVMRPLLPQGIAMHEVMLAPMPKEYRTMVQPRLVITATGAPVVSTASIRRSAMASPTRADSSRRLGAALVLGGLGAAAVVAGLALTTRRPHAEVPTPEPQPSSTAVASSAAPPLPSATAVESAAPPDVRRADVTIAPALPADAVVTIDDKPTSVSGGRVTLEGTLGSVHVVVVRIGKQERAFRISMTDKGALPDLVDVASLQPRPAAAGAKPAAKGPGAAPTTAPASDPAKHAPANASLKDEDLEKR